MKSILILCSAFVVAYAGVGTLSPQEEQQALELFQRACNGNTGGYGGGSGGDGSVDVGGFTVYCKRSRDDLQESLTHQVNVPANNAAPGQVVFVQPPSVRYQHNIQLSGSSGQAQQSKIYVLPQRATHQISTNYQPGVNNAVKPVVYFLKSKDGGSSVGAPAPPQYGSPTPPQYGAPGPQPVRQHYFSNGYNN